MLKWYTGDNLRPANSFWDLLKNSEESDFYAFCDQDDLWLPDHLALLRREMARLEAQYGPETPLLVHGDAEVMDAEGQLLHHSFFAHQGWDREARSLNRLLVQNNVTGCTTLLNAPLLRLVAAHARPEELVLHDWFVALTAAAFGQIGFVNAPLLRYRQHGRNVKGASHHSLRGRGVQALLSPRRGRERIALSYRNGEAFLRAYGEALPEEARKTVERYLAIASLGKLRRLQALRAGGYTMQAPVTRLGQILFG